MKLLTLSDYKKPNGSYDFEKYDNDCIEQGHKCYKCKSYISFNKNKFKQLCYNCESLYNDTDEITHSCYIRCPRCKEIIDIRENNLYELHKEGKHDIQCYNCYEEFKINTIVTIEFKSPELIKGDN